MAEMNESKVRELKWNLKKFMESVLHFIQKNNIYIYIYKDIFYIIWDSKFLLILIETHIDIIFSPTSNNLTHQQMSCPILCQIFMSLDFLISCHCSSNDIIFIQTSIFFFFWIHILRFKKANERKGLVIQSQLPISILHRKYLGMKTRWKDQI